jgi:hypothetical protein
MGTAQYWAHYWLGDSTAPVLTAPLAVREKAGVGRIAHLRLERAEEKELIDHFDVALQPADNDFLNALRDGQRASGTGVVWSVMERT